VLRQEATGVQSLAAEGALLAADAARGRSTSVFLRVHAAELGKTARMTTGRVANGRTPAAHLLAALAVRVDVRLHALSRSGSNRAEQRRIATELERAAAETSRLAKRL
jgi:hypothetical protein